MKKTTSPARVSNRTSKLKWSIGVVCVAVVCVAYAFMFLHTKEEVVQIEAQDALRQLSVMANTKGILKAQEFFLDHFFTYSDNNRHYLGHFLGEHIYKTYGISGISNCYSQIEFGCIHGFMLTGYMREGNGFLTQVIHRCEKDLPEGCMHGLGHAFLLILGYEPNHLRSALAQCTALAVPPGLKEQCMQGVYMEYNDRFIINSDNTISVDSFKPRTFDASSPLAPCDTEPQELQPVCFRELVLYWTNISSVTPEQMVNYCEMISLEKGKYECYWSLGGYLAGMSNSRLAPSVEACKATAPNAACFHGAINSVAFEMQTPVSALCSSIPPEFQGACATW